MNFENEKVYDFLLNNHVAIMIGPCRDPVADSDLKLSYFRNLSDLHFDKHVAVMISECLNPVAESDQCRIEQFSKLSLIF